MMGFRTAYRMGYRSIPHPVHDMTTKGFVAACRLATREDHTVDKTCTERTP